MNKKEKMRAFTMSTIFGGMGDTVLGLVAGILLNGWGEFGDDGTLFIPQSQCLAITPFCKASPNGKFCLPF